MAHWCDTWPHTIVTSVILKDNKIKLWKTGQNPLKDKYDIENLIKNHPQYSYQEKAWPVFNDIDHEKVFADYSKKWFKQWELHEKHLGGSPFIDDDFEGLIGGRYEVVKTLKVGS